MVKFRMLHFSDNRRKASRLITSFTSRVRRIMAMGEMKGRRGGGGWRGERESGEESREEGGEEGNRTRGQTPLPSVQTVV